MRVYRQDSLALHSRPRTTTDVESRVVKFSHLNHTTRDPRLSPREVSNLALILECKVTGDEI